MGQARLDHARVGCTGGGLVLLDIRNLLVGYAHDGLHGTACETAVLECHVIGKPWHEHQRVNRCVARKGTLHNGVANLHQGDIGTRVEHIA